MHRPTALKVAQGTQVVGTALADRTSELDTRSDGQRSATSRTVAVTVGCRINGILLRHLIFRRLHCCMEISLRMARSRCCPVYRGQQRTGCQLVHGRSAAIGRRRHRPRGAHAHTVAECTCRNVANLAGYGGAVGARATCCARPIAEQKQKYRDDLLAMCRPSPTAIAIARPQNDWSDRALPAAQRGNALRGSVA